MTRQGDDLAAQAVLARLGHGSDAARSIGDIAEELRWTRRQVELAVQSLRMQGFPVASGRDGVWIGDAQDMEQTYRYLRGRIASQSVTAWAVRSTLRRMRAVEVKQTTLFGEAA